MPQFMLLLHQSPLKFKNLSPEEIQQILAKYRAWREELISRNQLRGGEKLGNDSGRRLRVQNGQVSVADGPYSEASEVLGGYFVVEAADYDAAVAIARSCPHLSGSQWIEVRQIDVVH